jgi:hypothetical protein
MKRAIIVVTVLMVLVGCWVVHAEMTAILF